LAALVGGLFKNMRLKLQFYHDNSDINRNILRCCHEFKVRIITIFVYGNSLLLHCSRRSVIVSYNAATEFPYTNHYKILDEL
jgi:hypothetical protein